MTSLGVRGHVHPYYAIAQKTHRNYGDNSSSAARVTSCGISRPPPQRSGQGGGVSAQVVRASGGVQFHRAVTPRDSRTHSRGLKAVDDRQVHERAEDGNLVVVLLDGGQQPAFSERGFLRAGRTGQRLIGEAGGGLRGSLEAIHGQHVADAALEVVEDGLRVQVRHGWCLQGRGPALRQGPVRG